MAETEYKDKTIKCVDCGTEFVFTARDQEKRNKENN